MTSDVIRRRLVSGATGLLLAAAAGPLELLLGLPEPILRGACTALPHCTMRAAATLDLVWVADSLLLLILGPVSPTALGTAFVLVQALVALGFAVAHWTALRRASAAAEAAPAFV